MLFRKKSQPLLGLDITTSSVKLIELSQSGKRYRVESYSAEPTPPSSVSEKAIVDAKAVGEAIRRAVDGLKRFKFDKHGEPIKDPDTGKRVARELDRIVARRGRPGHGNVPAHPDRPADARA